MPLLLVKYGLLSGSVFIYVYIYEFQMNKDDCDPNVCQNNGRCIDEVGGFHCNCTGTGYTGNLCETNENECKSKHSPCLNGGICYDTYGSYVCECPTNYSGFNCEELVDPCSGHPCSHGGTCVGRKDSFHCICPRGFSGEFCENLPVCSKECPQNTECIAGKCCEIGKQCSLQTTSEGCSCLNGGTCTGDGSFCKCPEGFEGSKCEADVDECALNPNVCVHGICVNQPGTFKCYCEPGDFFKYFEKRQFIKMFFFEYQIRVHVNEAIVKCM